MACFPAWHDMEGTKMRIEMFELMDRIRRRLHTGREDSIDVSEIEDYSDTETQMVIKLVFNKI